VSLASPQRVLGLGENRCSEDWCIAVEDIARSTSPLGAEYVVRFRMSSRALRAPQRENGLVVYLVDEKGRRYGPAEDPAAVPFNVLLQPGQAVATIRRFSVCSGSRKLGVVVGREGSNSIPGRFIIGDDTSTGQGAICYRCSRSCCLQHTHVLETESSSGNIKRYKVDSQLQLIAAVRRHSIGQSQLKFICSGCINEAES
jgi:hypothetical protein